MLSPEVDQYQRNICKNESTMRIQKSQQENKKTRKQENKKTRKQETMYEAMLGEKAMLGNFWEQF